MLMPALKPPSQAIAWRKASTALSLSPAFQVEETNMYRILLAGLLLGIFGGSIARADGASAALAKRFEADVAVLLRKYCTDCHGPKNAKADLNIASFTRMSQISDTYRRWKRLLARLEQGEMPPADCESGSPHETRTWLLISS